MPEVPIDWTVIRDWISDHLVTCSVCEGIDWDLQENLLWETRQHHPGVGMAIMTGEDILITVTLTCKTCKHVVFFNASSILSEEYYKAGGTG